MTPSTSRSDLDYFAGPLQPQYECEEHARIGQMLDQYAIPFFYRQPMLVCDNGRRTIYRPDFTLPTYNNAVIECDHNHNGDARTCHHQPTDNVYRQNGIAALFLDRSDLATASWQQQLCDRLEEAYRQPLTYPSKDHRPGRG